DRDLDLDLGQEAHRVFSTAVDFRMALLPPISFDFRHRETMNANGGQGIADFFELEWLDDRHNNFHGSYPRYCPVTDMTERSRLRFTTRRKFTTRPQPGPIESNAVPDRRHCLTVYESANFRRWREISRTAPFRR